MSPFSKTDCSYMQMALTLAERGRGKTSPNPMVGAVIVKEGRVVGRGYHARVGAAHAEDVAICEAGELNQGATLYVTLEPCVHHGRTPPCAEAVVAAGIERVVAAMKDPNPRVAGKGFAQLREAGIRVDEGCLKADARRLNEFYVVFHEQKRPFITIKWAMSLCGRTAHDSGESRWITSKLSREQGHRLRAQHDGVLVGLGTVLNDDPMLNVRLPDYTGPQPKRIVIDGDLSIPSRARLLRERAKGDVILFTTPFAKQEKVDYFEREGCRVIRLPNRRRLLNMRRVMDELAGMGLISVLVEGGRQIHTSLLGQGLADKVVAFIAPKIIGGLHSRSPVEDLGLPSLQRALKVTDVRVHTIDQDICLEGYLHEI